MGVRSNLDDVVSGRGQMSDTRLAKLAEEFGWKILTAYAGQPVLQGLMTALSVVFPPVSLIAAASAAATTWGNDLSSKRVLGEMDELRRLVHGLGEKKVDKEFLRSEPGIDLLNQVLRESARTADPERRRMYAAILIGSATKLKPPELDGESMIGALAELSSQEVYLLSLLYAPPIVHPPLGVITRTKRSDSLLEARKHFGADLEFHLGRIARTGLIMPVGTLPGTRGYTGPQYVTTKTMDRLREFLSDVYAEAGLDPN